MIPGGRLLIPLGKISLTSPLILLYKDMAAKYPEHISVNILKEFGIQETLLVPLIKGGYKISTLEFHSMETDRFPASSFAKYTSLTDQVAVAISNILADEEIKIQLAEINELKKQLEAENDYLLEEVQTVSRYNEIIGTSNEIQKVFDEISHVAVTDSTVLILGETGTGKELVARAIHNASLRKDKLLVKVNCATLPVNLVESELFGHEQGSFTGATERRIGKFELANNGTLFLDEIGELTIELQSKILRALQEKEIERIGGKSVIKCDVRFIAATNRKLEEEVKTQKFRADLFFRLNIFPINLPPLKNRKEDIPLLAKHFLQLFCKKMNKKISGIEKTALQSLMLYQWPGNIRELENVIERAVIVNKTKMLKINLSEQNQQSISVKKQSADKNIFQVKSYKDAERDIIINALEVCKGKIRGVGGTAELLKINASTLESKMKKLGLVKKSKIDIVEE